MNGSKCPDPNSSLDVEPCAQQWQLLLLIKTYSLAPGLPVIATLSSKTNGPLVEFAKAMSAIAATTASPLLQIGMLGRLRLMTWHAVVSPTGLGAVCNTRSPKSCFSSHIPCLLVTCIAGAGALVPSNEDFFSKIHQNPPEFVFSWVRNRPSDVDALEHQYPVSDPAAVEPETMAAVFFPDSAARLRSRLSTAGAAFLNSSSHHDHQSD